MQQYNQENILVMTSDIMKYVIEISKKIPQTMVSLVNKSSLKVRSEINHKT